MQFEWDEAKERANREKHGFDFEAAVLVFNDPNVLIEPARMDAKTGELRWLAIGTLQTGATIAVLAVVHADRTKHDDEEKTCRIISARKARKSERRRYFQQTVE